MANFAQIAKRKIALRLDQLTFSRFIAALSIVIYHYGLNVSPFSSDTVSFLFEQANVGVSYFFILSGFIMIIAYARFPKVDAAEYLKNRLARIYPLLVLSVIPFIFACLFMPDKMAFSDLFFNLSTLQAWIPGKAVAGNYPLWSLSVEIFFYACFPFLFNYFYKKYSVTKIAIGVVLIWMLSIFVQEYLLHSAFVHKFEHSHNFIYYFPVMHLNQFLVGNLAGLLFLQRTPNMKAKYDIFIILALIGFVLLLKHPFGIDYHNGFLAVVFIPLIILQAQNTGYLTKLLSKKPFVFLGEISFGIYMLQFPVYMIMKMVLAKLNIINPEAVFFLSLVALIIASAVCHIYFELPLRNRIKNIQLKPVKIK